MRFSINVLPATFTLVSFMTREADAIYVPGIVRLFRGDGDLIDAANVGGSTDLTRTIESSPTFEDETPYNGVSRQVFYFDGTGHALGSPAGLPSGSEPRTIMGWIKKETKTHDNNLAHFFGYGGDIAGSYCNSAYGLFFSGTIFELDQWCTLENIDSITTTFDKWFHFAASWDGTENTLYIDGEIKGEAEPAQKPTTNTASTM